MVRGVCNSGQETGLCEAEFKGAKVAREELNDAGDLWWWDEKAVNTVDNAIRSKLGIISTCFSIGTGRHTMSMATIRL